MQNRFRSKVFASKEIPETIVIHLRSMFNLGRNVRVSICETDNLYGNLISMDRDLPELIVNPFVHGGNTKVFKLLGRNKKIREFKEYTCTDVEGVTNET